MKKCIKCSITQDFTSFYKHSGMKDGVLNKCKKCCKEESYVNFNKKMEDPLFQLSEKERQREKYKRLEYKEKQKKWDEDKPWKKTSIYKNLNRDLKLKSSECAHHWNYNNEFLRDVIILDKTFHKKIHKYLIFDKKLLIFKTIDNVLLDTKDKHLNYIKTK
jgi:L-rhamnose mutarotase